MLVEIRNKILSEILSLKDSPFKTIESYQGQLEEGESFKKRFPACLLKFNTFEFSPESSEHDYLGTAEYSIFIFFSNKRSHQENITDVESEVMSVINQLKSMPYVELSAVNEISNVAELVVYEIRFSYLYEEFC